VQGAGASVNVCVCMCVCVYVRVCVFEKLCAYVLCICLIMALMYKECSAHANYAVMTLHRKRSSVGMLCHR